MYVPIIYLLIYINSLISPKIISYTMQIYKNDLHRARYFIYLTFENHFPFH